MMKKISYAELAEKLWGQKETCEKYLPSPGFDFYCDYNQETGEKNGVRHATVAILTGSLTALISGGDSGMGFMYEIRDDPDCENLAGCLKNYLFHQGIGRCVWVDESDQIWIPSSVELGAGAVLTGKKAGDSTMRWWFRSTEIARGAERVVVIVEGGAVTEAYASNRSISVDVIDQDVQTPEDEDALADELKDLETDIEADILHLAYSR